MSKTDLASNREELGVVEDDKKGWPDPSYSSSPELSSPPRSSPEAPESISKQSTNETASRQNGSITVNASGVEAPTPAASVTPAPPVKERKKPGRKPKVHLNPDGSSATNTDVAPRKRAPRKPKDPNAAPPGPRKRKVTTSEAPNASESRAPSGKQPKLSETEIRPAETKFVVPPNLTLASQNGNSEGIPITSFFNSTPPQPTPPPQPQPQPQTQTQTQTQQTMQTQSQPQPQPQSQPQPVRSSGQNYDPIRSNYDPVRETVVTHNSYNNSQGSPQAPYAPNRASESPSISSLVDPPNQAMASPSIATQSFFNQQQARLQPDGRTSIPPSPTTNRLAPSPAIMVEARDYYNAPPPATATAPPTKMDSISAATPAVPSNISKKSTASSTAASPKPDKKQKEKEKYPTPPPLPGSGLMQLGGTDGTEFRAPTVCFEVTIQPGEGNKYVNFTKMAEERYGWDALHPRLAAQRERLARVAAAGAALERNGNKESGDEASNDDSDSENDVEMGGMSDARNGTDGGEKRVVKKRMMKEDFYDKDDGFVDDSELQWEEQAVAANDGFFVYSGPLVPETAKPELESAPKRGRGRGRGGASRGGPGSRGGRVPGAARPADATAPGVAPRPLAGPGSRGGAVTRKPRITKADRARMEQEKLEREKMGTLASAPNGYSGVPLASNIGTTPMVFNQ